MWDWGILDKGSKSLSLQEDISNGIIKVVSPHNLSISAAVLSLATVMPGEAAAITLDFTEYAGNFGIYGEIDATLDVTVNNGQATFTFTNNSDDLAITRIYFGQGLGSLLSGGEIVGADGTHFGSGTISDPAGDLSAWSGNFAKFGALPDRAKILFGNGLSESLSGKNIYDKVKG